jgi:hypothetical protein
MEVNEDNIQAQIIRYFRLYPDRCLAFHVPNGGTRNLIEAVKFKRIGVVAGVADIIVLLRGGRCVFLEVKTPHGRQSQRQKDFERRVNKLGFEYYVVRSVEEVMELGLV